jgi:hypothetical protein
MSRLAVTASTTFSHMGQGSCLIPPIVTSISTTNVA